MSRQRLYAPVIGNVGSILNRRSRKKLKNIIKESKIVQKKVSVADLLKINIQESFREDRYTHVSDVLLKCSRKIALSVKLGRQMQPKPIYDNTGIVYEIGNALHDFVIRKMKISCADMLYGQWTCHCKKEVHLDTLQNAINKGRCSICNGLQDNYNELVVKNDEYLLTGSIDLSLLINNALYITELKSITKSGWEALTRPYPDHVMQVLMYWFLLKEQGYSLYDSVSIIYIAKDFVIGNPFKEYIIENVSDSLGRLAPYLEDAKIIKFNKIDKNSELPVRTFCPTIDCKTAKKCEFAMQCFAL